MRIIGGEFKGKRVNIPGNFRARPTTDMAKESLFNILANHIDFNGLKVLDLFSGTGGIGFEFVSRGSENATLVENDFYHYKFILKTIELLKIGDYVKAIKGDAFKYLINCKEKYDLIFADPPYELKNIGILPQIVMGSDLLNIEGVFIMEHSGSYTFNEVAGYKETRNYGSVNFSFFNK